MPLNVGSWHGGMAANSAACACQKQPDTLGSCRLSKQGQWVRVGTVPEVGVGRLGIDRTSRYWYHRLYPSGVNQTPSFSVFCFEAPPSLPFRVGKAIFPRWSSTRSTCAPSVPSL